MSAFTGEIHRNTEKYRLKMVNGTENPLNIPKIFLQSINSLYVSPTIADDPTRDLLQVCAPAPSRDLTRLTTLVCTPSFIATQIVTNYAR